MKAEEIKKHYTIEIIDRSDNKWRVMEIDDVEDYTNQKVIEELEELLELSELNEFTLKDFVFTSDIQERIKELKQ